MDFKIDTRDTFSVITPVAAAITVKLTDELRAEMGKVRQSGSQHFIIDLQNCTSIDKEAIEKLIAMHEECYGMDTSLVFTGTGGSVLASLKEEEADMIINVAPKMIEAVDIISMEILERDLFGEES